MSYKFFVNQTKKSKKNKNTRQSQPIPGRETEMIQGRCGGYMFKADLWQVLPQVVRTGSHFYEWLNYTKSMRGFGKIVREAGQDVSILVKRLLNITRKLTQKLKLYM